MRQHLARGRELLADREFGAAEREFSAGLEVHESNIALLMGRGWSLANAGKAQEAMVDFRYASKLAPDVAGPHIGLPETYKATNSYRNAMGTAASLSSWSPTTRIFTTSKA